MCIRLVQIPRIICSFQLSRRESVTKELKSIVSLVGVVEIFVFWPLKGMEPVNSASRVYREYRTVDFAIFEPGSTIGCPRGAWHKVVNMGEEVIASFLFDIIRPDTLSLRLADQLQYIF